MIPEVDAMLTMFPFRGAQVGDRKFRREKDAFEIGVNDIIPVRLGHPIKGLSESHDARIVDKNIKATKAIHRRFDYGLTAGDRGNGAGRGHEAITTPEFMDGLGRGLGCAAVQGDAGLRFQERLDDPTSNTARSSRNQNRLSLKFMVVLPH